MELVQRTHAPLRPALRRELASTIGDNVAAPVDAKAGYDDAGIVRVRARRHSRIDSDHHAHQVGPMLATIAVKPLSGP